MQRILYRVLVRPVEFIRKVTGAHIWQIEVTFVVFILIGMALMTQRPWVEWIGVGAVTLTFCHATVANRLEEMEGERVRQGEQAKVECYKWLQRYFYGKEALWFVYFLLIHAYSALVGVVVFFFYGKWRTLWRRYHPIGEEECRPA